MKYFREHFFTSLVDYNCFINFSLKSALTWPRQSLVAISAARSNVTTVTGFGQDSNPQPSDFEKNPSARPHYSISLESNGQQRTDLKSLHWKKPIQV